MGGVANTIAELGDGVGDGDLGIITVNQDGDTVSVPLVWDDTAGVWVGTRIMRPITSMDGDWCSSKQGSANWQYVGRANTSDLGKTNLRAGGIACSGALFAAGLRLQDRISAHIRDNGTNQIYLAAWFYEYDNTGAIVFDNDNAGGLGNSWNGTSDSGPNYGFQPSSQNIGHGAVLTKTIPNTTKSCVTVGVYDDGITTSGYHTPTRGTGWDYVLFFTPTQKVGTVLGGVPTTTPTTPTKKYLYATLYGKGIMDQARGWVNICYDPLDVLVCALWRSVI